MPAPRDASLDPTLRDAIRPGSRRVLTHFRSMATGKTRSRARLLVAGSRVQGLRIDQEGATATIDDTGQDVEVRASWHDTLGARCGCAPFRRQGTCVHMVALLEAVKDRVEGQIAAASSASTAGGTGTGTPAPKGKAPSTDGPPDGIPEWLRRVEAVAGPGPASPRPHRSAERSARDPWARAADGDSSIRYVLRFRERRGEVDAHLEPQTLTLTGDESQRWKPIPFVAERKAGGAAPGPSASAFGGDHASVAAIASGAVESVWHDHGSRRAIASALVDRALAGPLLRTASSASELRVALDGHRSPLTCEDALDGFTDLEVEADDETADLWILRGHLRLPDGTRVPAAHAREVSSGGLVLLVDPRSSGEGGQEDEASARIALLESAASRPLLIDLSRAPLRVPRQEIPALTAIAGFATLVGDGLRAAARPVGPTPCLRADAPLEVEQGVRIDCFLHFDYEGTAVPIGSTVDVVGTVRGRTVPRRRDEEDTALRRFRELGGRPAAAGPKGAPSATVSAGRFLGMISTLVDEGWNVMAKDQVVRSPGSVDVSVRAGVDWFDLVGGVDFGNDEIIPFPTVLEAAREQRGYVTLGDGSKGLLPETWLARWRLAALGAEDGDTLRFERNQAWVLAALADEREAEAGDPLGSLRDAVHGLAAPRATPAPAAFEGELRPYQEEGLGWLLALDDLGLSGCLADDMGLGKTVQLLAYLLARRAQEAPAGHSLVVAPRSLIFNWIHEGARFAPTLPMVDFTGPNRWSRLEAAAPGSVLVTTYGALRRDAEALAESELDVVVLDEAHAIKSRTSQTATAARALRSRRRVALTGTPVENHLGELWSLLEFLNPGMLGTRSAFQRLGAPRGRIDLEEDAKDVLARALRPFLLRRTKGAVLSELPPKVEQVLRAPMTRAQESAYAELSTYFRSELVKSKREKRQDKFEEVGAPTLNVLAALTRLRQCACHPGLVDKGLVAEPSGKLELVLPMIESLVRAGRKAIVFSSFTGLLGLLRTRLETAHLPYYLLEGATRDRRTPVERFQSCEGGAVFLVSIKAGGAGLNLTAADTVFLLDPWWNPAVEAQAIDRAHRMGQSRTVHVYRVLTENTVEARVVELQSRKAALAEAVLAGAPAALDGLSADDLGFLLS